VSGRGGGLGRVVRLLLRLFPDDVPGITRPEMEETFFDLMEARRRRGERRSLIPALWNLAWAGLAERVASWRRIGVLRGVRQDARFAVRSLVRSPAFTLGAVVMLALGVGATNAMYSMHAGMSRVAERFDDPDELVFLWGREPGQRRVGVSRRELEVWRSQATAFQEMGFYGSRVRYLGGGDEPVRTREVQVSPHLLPMLGLSPELGRLPGEADTRAGTDPVAVLTWQTWQERFGGAGDVVGRSLKLDDVTHTVIGVLPENVQFDMWWEAGVFTPLPPESTSGGGSWEDRTFAVIARLADGVTMDQARAQMEVLTTRLQADPEAREHVGATLEPFRDYFYSREDRLGVGLLIAAVFALLLIACVNLANLLLARGAARHGEVAVRLAVGASRWQIVRRLLMESLLLAFLGGAGGIVLGAWGLRLLLAGIPTMPFLPDEVGLDPALLLFTLSVSTAAALAFGLTPALLASRVSVGDGLRQLGAAASGGRARKRFRAGILVAQIVLTVPLVLTCVVAFRHVRALETVDFGLDTGPLLTVRVDLPPFRYPDGAQQSEFIRQAEEALARIPGVEAVGAGVDVPIGAGSRTQVGPLVLEGHESADAAERGVRGYKAVTSGFFGALGAHLVAGRELTPDDGAAAPRVALVNEALVRRFWPDVEPLGRRLTPDTLLSGYLGPEWSQGPPFTVVGVVRDFGATFYGDPPQPTVYLAQAQVPTSSMLLVVRATQDPGTLVPLVRQTLRRLDPQVPTTSYLTGEGLLDAWLQESRTIAAILGVLGGLALGLAVLGLYGMVAYSVTQRSFELGMRMVLGADRRSVRFAVMRSFLVLGGAGVLGGLVVSSATALVLRDQLVMLRVSLVATAALIAALLLAVVALASYLPARRATVIEPVRALRCT